MSALNEDFAILDPAANVQEAYDESKRPKWGGKPLNPWTIARHSVALTLGCKLITAVGPFVSEFIKDGTYGNLYRDVIIVLYLSSLSAEEIINLDVHCEPAEAMRGAFEWAEENSVAYGSRAFLDGVKLLSQTLNHILSSRYESSGTGDADVKKNSGHPGKSNSHSEQYNQEDFLRAT